MNKITGREVDYFEYNRRGERSSGNPLQLGLTFCINSGRVLHRDKQGDFEFRYQLTVRLSIVHGNRDRSVILTTNPNLAPRL